MLCVSNRPGLHLSQPLWRQLPLPRSQTRSLPSGCWPGPPQTLCTAGSRRQGPSPLPWTLLQFPQIHASLAVILLPFPKVSLWSPLSSCCPGHHPPSPGPPLQHTHDLAQLLRALRPSSLSTGVAGTSHGHRHFCWIGTDKAH